MVISDVNVVVTISCRSFAFSQSRAKVSAGFTNVSDPAVATFDLAYSSAPCLTLVSSRRKVVIGLCGTRKVVVYV